MVQQSKIGIRRLWHGRYFVPRVNRESVPCLTVAAVSCALDDPRRVPYLLVWKNRSGEIVEAVRVSSCSRSDGLDWTGWVEVKRTNGSRSLVRTVQRFLPRNGGRSRLIVCPQCQTLRRAVYGWRLNPHRLHAVVVDSWKCRECARLRYASEGGALLHRPRTTIGKMLAAIDDFTRHDRPEPLYPYASANPADLIAAMAKTLSIARP